MKRLIVLALFFVVASSLFAQGSQIAGTTHAENGYDYRDTHVTVLVVPSKAGMLWLNADYSYPLLFSERDRLANLVQTAAKKIDLATAKKTTISYSQEIGRFYTENGALIVVNFDTGYGLSNAVIRITGDGNSDILLLNKKDTEDLVTALGNANNLIDDYQKQVALFE